MKIIKTYIYDNRWTFFVGSIVFYLLHGNQIFTDSIRIDTVNMILDPKGTINWMGLGRFGAVIIRWIFEFGLNFNPYYSVALGIILYMIAMVTFAYLFDEFFSIPAFYTVIMYLIFMSHPIWAEQFYFQLQVLPFGVAMLLIPVSILLQMKASLKKNYILYMLSIFCLVLIFGTYQSFVCIYIIVVMFCTMMFARKMLLEEEKQFQAKKIFGNLFQFMIIFLIAITTYQLIAQYGFGLDSYLTAKVEKKSLFSTLYVWKDNVDMILAGEGIFYNCAYLISGLLALGAFLYDLLKQKWNIGWKILYACVIGLLQLMIISMTIVMSEVPMFRVQIYLPFVIGINFLYAWAIVGKYKKITSILVGVAIAVILLQTQSLYQLYYTDHIQYEHDMRTFTLLLHDIGEVMGEEDKPVAFIGTIEKNKDTFKYPNKVYQRGEIIGTSFFGVNSWDEPYYWYSTIQIVRFFQSNNYKIEAIEKAKMIEVRKKAQETNMPIWPVDGSVVDAGEYIIVKIAEDEYYEEDFEVE